MKIHGSQLSYVVGDQSGRMHVQPLGSGAGVVRAVKAAANAGEGQDLADVGTLSRECVPEGKTALCCEFTCNMGDATWNASEEELTAYAVNILKEMNILTPDDVEGACMKRVSHAYPRFRKGYEVRLKTVGDLT